MDYEKLKTEIDAIVKIVESVPENLRVKCFEILLKNYLVSLDASHPDDTGGPSARPIASTNIPSDREVVMRQIGVTEKELSDILVFDGSEIHFISEPNAKSKAHRVVQWALLLALRNALTSDKGDLRVDPEALRSICQDKGCYDAKNFWGTLKSSTHAPLFAGRLQSQGDARVLSPKGKAALKDLIRELAGQ
ncbi:MAG: hypothetical protein OXC91_02785 [Rhodobacteraceae bacterium]|nr:hypothetical protein [Paracoccaceae bacterium]